MLWLPQSSVANCHAFVIVVVVKLPVIFAENCCLAWEEVCDTLPLCH
jgi:hypothetical protein